MGETDDKAALAKQHSEQRNARNQAAAGEDNADSSGVRERTDSTAARHITDVQAALERARSAGERVAVEARGDPARGLAARTIEGAVREINVGPDGRARAVIEVAEAGPQIVLVERVVRLTTTTSDSEPSKQVFDAHDIATFCATDVATIYTWVKKGEIAYFKTPGGRFRFARESVIDFLRRYRFPVPRELLEGPMRVIAVDPDSSWLTTIGGALGRGFDLVAFTNAFDALLAIGDQKPDAIIMEPDMPAVDGLRLIRRIRAQERLRHTRVVVFASLETQRQACLDAGAAAFVLKPGVDELHGTLRRALGQR